MASEVWMKRPVFEMAPCVWMVGLHCPSHLCVDGVAFARLCLCFIYRSVWKKNSQWNFLQPNLDLTGQCRFCVELCRGRLGGTDHQMTKWRSRTDWLASPLNSSIFFFNHAVIRKLNQLLLASLPRDRLITEEHTIILAELGVFCYICEYFQISLLIWCFHTLKKHLRWDSCNIYTRVPSPRA